MGSWFELVLERRNPSILKDIEDEGILQVTPTDRGFCLVECCDYYHGVTLNEAQMREFIAELQAMVDKKPDSGVNGRILATEGRQ